MSGSFKLRAQLLFVLSLCSSLSPLYGAKPAEQSPPPVKKTFLQKLFGKDPKPVPVPTPAPTAKPAPKVSKKKSSKEMPIAYPVDDEGNTFPPNEDQNFIHLKDPTMVQNKTTGKVFKLNNGEWREGTIIDGDFVFKVKAAPITPEPEAAPAVSPSAEATATEAAPLAPAIIALTKKTQTKSKKELDDEQDQLNQKIAYATGGYLVVFALNAAITALTSRLQLDPHERQLFAHNYATLQDRIATLQAKLRDFQKEAARSGFSLKTVTANLTADSSIDSLRRWSEDVRLQNASNDAMSAYADLLASEQKLRIQEGNNQLDVFRVIQEHVQTEQIAMADSLYLSAPGTAMGSKYIANSIRRIFTLRLPENPFRLLSEQRARQWQMSGQASTSLTVANSAAAELLSDKVPSADVPAIMETPDALRVMQNTQRRIATITNQAIQHEDSALNLLEGKQLVTFGATHDPDWEDHRKSFVPTPAAAKQAESKGVASDVTYFNLNEQRNDLQKWAEERVNRALADGDLLTLLHETEAKPSVASAIEDALRERLQNFKILPSNENSAPQDPEAFQYKPGAIEKMLVIPARKTATGITHLAGLVMSSEYRSQVASHALDRATEWAYEVYGNVTQKAALTNLLTAVDGIKRTYEVSAIAAANASAPSRVRMNAFSNPSFEDVLVRDYDSTVIEDFYKDWDVAKVKSLVHRDPKKAPVLLKLLNKDKDEYLREAQLLIHEDKGSYTLEGGDEEIQKAADMTTAIEELQRHLTAASADYKAQALKGEFGVAQRLAVQNDLPALLLAPEVSYDTSRIVQKAIQSDDPYQVNLLLHQAPDQALALQTALEKEVQALKTNNEENFGQMPTAKKKIVSLLQDKIKKASDDYVAAAKKDNRSSKTASRIEAEIWFIESLQQLLGVPLNSDPTIYSPENYLHRDSAIRKLVKLATTQSDQDTLRVREFLEVAGKRLATLVPSDYNRRQLELIDTFNPNLEIASRRAELRARAITPESVEKLQKLNDEIARLANASHGISDALDEARRAKPENTQLIDLLEKSRAEFDAAITPLTKEAAELTQRNISATRAPKNPEGRYSECLARIKASALP